MNDLKVGDLIEYSHRKYGLIISIKKSTINNELEVASDILCLWVLDENGILLPVVFTDYNNTPKPII